jgi:putative spermidine/putrescine transport system substrate-binding protein
VGELTRRAVLERSAAAAAALAVSAAPNARSAPENFDGTIRIVGIGYDLLEPIRKRAETELGLRIVSTVDFPATLERLVRQRPGDFDVFSGFNSSVDPLWAVGSFQPVEIARIERWTEVTPLLKLGKVRPGDRPCTYGQGDAVLRKLYVDPDRSGRWRSARHTPAQLDGLIVEWENETTGKAAGAEPLFCTGVPHIFNFDSLGYDARAIRKRPSLVSWAELLNSRWRGRVGLAQSHEVGLLDAGNAARAAGLLRIADLGNLTRGEIDRLVKLLLLWSDFGSPIQWMQGGRIVISSMYALQISSLVARGLPVRQAAPPEGYRAFSGMLFISSEVRDRAKLEACYRFLNWWQSGFAGSVLLRQGYFSAAQAPTRRFVARGEFDYWLHGKAADRNYAGPFGDVSVRKGQVRDGGSFEKRACRISVWNSRDAPYVEQRWQDFASSFTPP